jgi:hypothetical protein
LLNVGLSPFLHWHQRAPEVAFFVQCTLAMGVSSVCFLFFVNRMLRRLAAMLPDETLRAETAVFTTLNGSLLVLLPGVLAAYVVAVNVGELPLSVRVVIQLLEPIQQWLVLFLVLLPVAVTMSLIWKIKEAVFSSVFEQGLHQG